MDEAVEMLERRQVQVEPLITAEYRLDDAPQALEAAAKSDSIKILIRP
jgi:threonine dehydrogenase-like Zn-dependent dehydrogenase